MSLQFFFCKKESSSSSEQFLSTPRIKDYFSRICSWDEHKTSSCIWSSETGYLSFLIKSHICIEWNVFNYPIRFGAAELLIQFNVIVLPTSRFQYGILPMVYMKSSSWGVLVPRYIYPGFTLSLSWLFNFVNCKELAPSLFE